MKKETVETIVQSGATWEEARAAMAFYGLLRPALRRKRENGRFDLAGGDKSVLGLYRTALRVIEENPHDYNGQKAIMDLFRPALKMNKKTDRISLSTGDVSPRGFYWAVREFMSVKSKPVPAEPEPAIWLNEDEDEGELDCGCRLVRDHKDGGPALFLCPTHGGTMDLSRPLDGVTAGTPTVGPWSVLRLGRKVPHLMGGDHCRIALLDDCHLDAEAKANEAVLACAWEVQQLLRRMTEKVWRVIDKHYVGGIMRLEDRREMATLAADARDLLKRSGMGLFEATTTTPKPMEDGTSGQDRKSYSDTQDRKNYT